MKARVERERPNPVRLVILLAVLAGLLVVAGRRFGRVIWHAIHRSEPKVVPHEGAPVLPLVRRSHAPGAHAESVHVLSTGGKTRRYILLAPKVPPAGPLPLVLVLHGDGGSADSFHDGYPFELATGPAALVAYPEGVRSTWDLDGRSENPDVAYVDALVADVAQRHPVDRARVFGTGYSSGGFFLNLMACERPGFFRAIASNAGGAPYGRAETWPNGFPKCPGQRPIPMLALHGTQDWGVTVDSGAFSAQYWAYVNGCDTGTMETTGYAECHAYKCPKDRPAAFCKVEGLGHWVWDRGAEATWTFFLGASP